MSAGAANAAALQSRTKEVIARSQAWRAIHMPHTIAPETAALSALGQIALDLARLGYYVYPLAPEGKIPLKGSHGYKDATIAEATIHQWWQATPDANVGINLQLSGILDIAPDCEAWADQFTVNGMPPTLSYTSGGGVGHAHNLYRLPAGGPVARACVPHHYDIMSEGCAVAPGSIHPSGRPYALLTPLIPAADLPPAPAWAVAMIQTRPSTVPSEHTPAGWANLPDGAVLPHCGRFKALCRANDQLRAVCAGAAVTLTFADGSYDHSRSAQRSVFVKQLIYARFPPNEIRALALHFQDVLESDPDTFRQDIDRLIVKYTPNDYQPEPTNVIVMALRQPLRGGRHYEITTGELLDAYRQHAAAGVLDWTLSQSADQLHVSTGTIKRREAELIAEGQIRRDYGRVILIGAIGSQCTETPQIVETEPARANLDVRALLSSHGYTLNALPPMEMLGRRCPAPYELLGLTLKEPGVKGRWDAPATFSSSQYLAEWMVKHLPEWAGQRKGTLFRQAVKDIVDALACENVIGSQFVSPQRDAVNDEAESSRNERAHVESTHPSVPQPPALADEWAGIDQAIADWEQTTADGWHFAKLRQRQAAAADDLAQLAGVLRPAWRELVGEVRALAKQLQDPGWVQRDYAAMSVAALLAELRRLGGAGPKKMCGFNGAISPPGLASGIAPAQLGLQWEQP